MNDLPDYWAGSESDGVVRKKHSDEKLIADVVMLKKNIRQMNMRISGIKDLVGLPLESEHIRLVTQKAFTSTDFLSWINEKELITDISIAVYRMNGKSVSTLEKIAKETGAKVDIVLSSFFRTSKKAEAWHDRLAAMTEKQENWNLMYCVNHAKVMAIKTQLNSYVIEGSGNMSDNARIEQYTLCNDAEVFDFHSKWILELTRGGHEQSRQNKTA